jgi:aspartate/methionine/tyrosine aminotransferase
MNIEPFLLEQWIAKHQFASPPIRYDLAASTGPKWTVRDVLDMGGDEARQALDETRVSYTPANGGIELRTQIARLHGVAPETVVVTTGASEALSALFCLLVEPNSNVVLPFPVFPGMPALARIWGYQLRSYELSRDDGFEHRAARILEAVDANTKLVLVNSPHNPSGAVAKPAELASLAEALAERKVPLVVDEVYHPLYFGPPAMTTARLANTVVISDMSKAFSLSGLRIGWVIDADASRRERLVEARGYFTISNSVVTEFLGALALQNAPRLLERLESVARSNLALLEDFMDANRDVVSWVPPVGGTVVFPWLNSGADARPFCEALAARGVLTAPGDCFNIPSHFRIGLGAQAEGFADALAIATGVLRG